MRATDDRHVCVVWIDSRAATIVRLVDGSAVIERLVSDVPVHHRGGMHVRHDPAIRPGGGGGTAATSDEPRRLEHLARFLRDVAERLPDGDLELIGPGTVHEHLASTVRAADRAGHRRISEAPSAPLTDRQLVARMLRLSGHEPRRRGDRGGPAPTGQRALGRRTTPSAT
jgi:hypothetical protein